MIKTLNYEFLPIAKSDRWLHSEVLDTLEDCEGNFYEVRETLNGALIALLIP